MPLLEIVLGRDLAQIHISDATLPDHGVYWAKDQSFPMIVAQAGNVATGLLLRGLSETDIARLDFYESGFEYDLSPVAIQTGTGVTENAQVFFPDTTLWSKGAPWSLTDWVRDWGALSCRAAIEVMGYFGTLPDEDIGHMFPMILARAAAELNGMANSHLRSPSGLSAKNVHVQQRKRAYVDFFALDEYVLSFDRFDGSQTGAVKRAVFVGGDAAIVLPYDPVRDRVLLVEQMRMGPIGRCDRDVWQLEPIAGRLDAGETPEATARREAFEEAGLTLGRIEKVAECYPSPGASSEFFYLYVGLADLPDSLNGTGGMDSEDENIRAHVLSFGALMEMVEDCDIRNAPLALAALWLARHRDRLRATA